MRQAAVVAGLVPDEQAGVDNGGDEEWWRVMVVDAGGGTIDISSYGKTGPDSKSFEEVAAPQCAYPSLTRTSLVTNPTWFDKTTKLRFRRSDEPSFIKFGRTGDRDHEHDIRSGQIKLDGTVVADFFQPSIDCAIEVTLEHRRDHNINTVFLVGGFVASDWLFHRVQAAVQDFSIDVCRPFTSCYLSGIPLMTIAYRNKVVADGMVSFFIDHFVSTRVSKFHYGTKCGVPYMPWTPNHRARSDKQSMSVSGEPFLPDAFAVILPKDTRVSEEKEFRQRYYRARDTIDWADEDEDNLEVLCTIEADTSLASRTLAPEIGLDGQALYALRFDIALLFGLTEFKAQFCWTENGEEKRGPARVIYSTE
ncbi:hypothetical protein BDN72DRAFT_901684 [Pluteus cervinus]|uniref:Uncharacterized protein n=1 Tax=Pluteus cervinus TaxID=181527 RepID=A0ACD3AEX8_9AGAR|nr:hypothetical protein BDN72DRAFT_901684 [Pluteus cervinus]